MPEKVKRAERRGDGPMPPALASSQMTFRFGDQLHESLLDKLIHESVEVAP